jgi:hypothetical protein
MAASRICQIVMAAKPIATAATRKRPSGCSASVRSAPD